MIIALDIDGTYTNDQQLWHGFISDCKKHGHEIIAVTMRYPNELNDDVSHTLSQLVRIYPTSRQQKRQFMQKLDIWVSVWIDDMPEAV